MTSEEHRVRKALAFVQRRMPLPFTFVVDESEYEPALGGVLQVGRAEETHPLTFVVAFDQDEVRDLSTAELRSAVFHELLHTTFWDLRCHARKAGAEKAYVLTEQATILLERSLAWRVLGHGAE